MISPYAFVGMPQTKKEKTENVINKVCNYLQVNKSYVLGKCRYRSVVEARQIISAILRDNVKLKLREIGKALNQDHTTVIHSIQSLQNRLDTEPLLKLKLEQLKIKIL